MNNRSKVSARATLYALCLPMFFGVFSLTDLQPVGAALTARVLTKSGSVIEGTVATSSLAFKIGNSHRRLHVRNLLSFHSAEPASSFESSRITADLALVLAGNDKGPKATDTACAELVDIGLPVMSPLLALYKDTDAHEPNPLYRLFARIVPGYVDGPDRTLDLIRPRDGMPFRGKLAPANLNITSAGKEVVVPTSEVRSLAIRQDVVEKTFALEALRHCSYVAYLDTGMITTAASTIRADSEGFVRLSFDEDGWASDPDGIADPLPGKRRLQEGFRWGAVLGRIGANGERWLAGKHVEMSVTGAGRLYFVINDNEHWENNIGAYRVRMRVTNAYDLGDPQ
jgi:hypothetical protein